jgi:hypothetical protein
VTGSAPRKPFLRGVGGCLAGLVTLAASFVAADALVSWAYSRPVAGPLPGEFPLVAMARPAPGAAAVPYLLNGASLARFRKDHPDHSFLLSVDGEDEIGRHLATAEQPYAEGLHITGLEVDQRSGRQRIEVQAPWHSDAVNVAVYETSGTDIMPVHARRGHMMSFVGPTMAAWVGLVAIAAVVKRMWLRRNDTARPA